MPKSFHGLPASIVLLLVGMIAPRESRADVLSWSDIDRALHGLTDGEPEVRSAARETLMGLTPADLPRLRAAVFARPVPPGLTAGLRDVVTYVVSRAIIQAFPNQGEAMLGVTLGDTSVDPQNPLRAADDPPAGVPIARRLPGFAGYRYFESGDLILGFGDGPTFTPAVSRPRVQAFVLARQPGTAVTVRILRQGRVITITVPLDRRPRDGPRPRPGDPPDFAEETTLRDRVNDAVERGETAFQTLFADLLGEDGA